MWMWMTELDTRGIRSVMLWMELCLARLHHDEKGQRLKDVAAQIDQLFSLGVQLEQKNCITNHDKSPCLLQANGSFSTGTIIFTAGIMVNQTLHGSYSH